MMKSRPGLVIAAVVFALAAEASAQVTVTITGPSTTRSGETITASVDLSGNAAALQFEVPLGSVVTLGSGAGAAGKQLACANTISSIRCLIFGLNPNLLTGQAAALVFPGQTTLGVVTLLATNVVVADPTAQEAAHLVVGLEVTVLSPCDLDSDGSTDVQDVLLIVQQALGNAACSDDMNADGACNIVDVQVLANVALGALTCPLIPSAPIGAGG